MRSELTLTFIILSVIAITLLDLPAAWTNGMMGSAGRGPVAVGSGRGWYGRGVGGAIGVTVGGAPPVSEYGGDLGVGDGVGDGSKAALDDPSSQMPPLDQYAGAPSTSDSSGVQSDASVPSPLPTTVSVSPSAITTDQQAKLDQLYAEGDKLQQDLKNAQAQIDEKMKIWKDEQAIDKIALGKPNTKPGELDYLPYISASQSTVVDQINALIKARNDIVAAMQANKAALSAQRQAIWGSPKSSKPWWQFW